MSKNKIIISNISDFLKFIEDYTGEGSNYIFRGHKLETYKLIPSIGRMMNKIGEESSTDDEELMLKIFKHRTYPFTKEFHDNSNLELLTIAQHHGLPKRLLDWTKNILIAVYFAVEDVFSKPAHPYVQMLIKALPSMKEGIAQLISIPGAPPRLKELSTGCSFLPRCPLGDEGCSLEVPPYVEIATGHGAACFKIDRLSI